MLAVSPFLRSATYFDLCTILGEVASTRSRREARALKSDRVCVGATSKGPGNLDTRSGASGR
eukprot:999773-Alexandrium_andersonii.AAC.1